MEEQLKLILSKLENLETDMKEIRTILEDNTRNCEKIAGHVEFVERVYDTVKSPMYFVCNQINKISGNQIEDTARCDDE